VLLALTAGEIVWNSERRDFDWTRTTALPRVLGQVFDAEPLWVDLRWTHDATDFPAHPRFRDCVADLAAPLHGRAKDDLVGEDVRQARRMRRLTWVTIALLSVLAAGLGWMSFEAERRRRIAALERDHALTSQSHYLADAARRQITEGEPETGVLLAVEALPRPEQERPYVPEAEAALYSALGALGPRNTAELRVSRTPASSVSYRPDGKRLVTVDGDETATVWDSGTGKKIATLKGHQEPIWCAKYVPDGSNIVTVSVDGTARLWNAETGAEIRIFRGHQGAVVHAAISADGRLLATASADSTARVWQIDTGAELATLRGHTQPLCCIQITPRGRRVATASLDGAARLWDTQTGKTLAVFKGTPQALSAIAGRAVVLRFSPDGKLLVTSHTDNTARIWYASDGTSAAVLKGGTAEVQDGAFSNDNRFLALTSGDGVARVWKLEWTDDEKLGPLSDPVILHLKQEGSGRQQHNAVIFGADSKFAATAGDFLQTWDPTNGSELAALRLDAPAESMIASPDARRFAITHLDHVMLWEVVGVNFIAWRLRQILESVPHADLGPAIATIATGPNFTWEDQLGWVPPVAVSRDARTAAAATGREIILFDGQTGRSLRKLAGHSRVVSRAVFNAAGDRLVTASYDGSVKIWDVRTGANLMTLSGHQGRILDAALSPSADVLATASEDHTARLWSLNSGADSVLRGHGAAVRRVAFSGDGTRLVTLAEDHTARVWDVASKKELCMLHGDQGGFGAAALNPSGDRVLTAGTGKDFTVRLWETATGRELHRWQESKGTVLGLSFSSDGQTTVAWGADGVARLRRAQGRYDRVSNVGSGCAGPGSIAQAYLSGNGERVITVLHNGRTDLWESRSGTSVLTLHTFPGAKSDSGCGVSFPSDTPDAGSAAASADLQNVLVAGDNGALVLFSLPGMENAIRLARKLVPRALTVEERRKFFLAE
jgi:WD40 repeat protein